MFDLLRPLGAWAANQYVIFLIYVIFSLGHIFFIFKIAEALFPDLKTENVGLIALFMFLYDHPVLTGAAYHQLVSIHCFRPTLLNSAFIAAGLYFFFKNRYLLSLSILCVLAVPMHFRSAWVIAATVYLYLWIFERPFSFKRIAYATGLVLISVAILFWYKLKAHLPVLNFDQRLEMLQVAMDRYDGEGNPLKNTWFDFFKLFILITPAVWAIGRLKDPSHRLKLYFFFGFSFFLFFLGGVYLNSGLYKMMPSLEIFSLGFAQVINYPIILSFVLLGGVLLRLAVTSLSHRGIGIALLFFLAYWPNFKMKSIPIYLGLIAITYFLVYRHESRTIKMGLRPLTAWMFATIICFLLIKDVQRIFEAYRLRSVYFPFITANFDRDAYDTQIWAEKNTSLNSLFAAFCLYEGQLYFDNSFRQNSGRTMLSGDVAVLIGHYDFVREHFRREEFLKRLSGFISRKEERAAADLISSSPWKIDYLVLPKGYALNYSKVYENPSYSMYKIGD